MVELPNISTLEAVFTRRSCAAGRAASSVLLPMLPCPGGARGPGGASLHPFLTASPWRRRMARGQRAIAVPTLAFAPVKRVSRVSGWGSAGETGSRGEKAEEQRGRMERLTTDMDLE